MPEVRARRALSGRIASFSVLAPVGSYAGRGTLRVLRASSCPSSGETPAVDLVCGYDAYERVG